MQQSPNYGMERLFTINSPVYIQKWTGNNFTDVPHSNEEALLLFNGTKTSCNITFTGVSVIGDRLYFRTPESLYCIYIDGDADRIDADISIMIKPDLTPGEIMNDISTAFSEYKDIIVSYDISGLTITSKAGGLTDTPYITWTNATLNNAVSGTGDWFKLGKVAADILVSIDEKSSTNSEKETTAICAKFLIDFSLTNITNRTYDILKEWNNADVNLAFFDNTNSILPIAIHHNIIIRILPDLMNKDGARFKFLASREYHDWENYVKFYSAPYYPLPIVYTQFLQDIDNLRNTLDADFVLERDLDFNLDSSYDQTDPDWQTKKTAWTTGDGFPIIQNYAGTFDGKGFTISNFYQDCTNTAISNILFLGLFLKGDASSMTIKNLGLLNVNLLNSSGNAGGGFGGALLSYLGSNSEAIIENCYSTGTITDSGYEYMVHGGLIGKIVGNANISKCYSACNIYSAAWIVGGFVGQVDNGSISDCYSTGEVYGKDNFHKIGGFVGYATNTAITNCYSAGMTKGAFGYDASAGFGRIGTGCSGLDTCYYNTDTEGDSYTQTETSATGSTTAQMQYPYDEGILYTDWNDPDHVWQDDTDNTNGGYPEFGTGTFYVPHAITNYIAIL